MGCVSVMSLKVEEVDLCCWLLCRGQAEIAPGQIDPLSCRVGLLGAEPGWEGYSIQAAIQWLRKNSRLPSMQSVMFLLIIAAIEVII